MSKVAAVVGAGPGLGKSIALRFAKGGYTVPPLRPQPSFGPSPLNHNIVHVIYVIFLVF